MGWSALFPLCLFFILFVLKRTKLSHTFTGGCCSNEKHCAQKRMKKMKIKRNHFSLSFHFIFLPSSTIPLKARKKERERERERELFWIISCELNCHFLRGPFARGLANKITRRTQQMRGVHQLLTSWYVIISTRGIGIYRFILEERGEELRELRVTFGNDWMRTGKAGFIGTTPTVHCNARSHVDWTGVSCAHPCRVFLLLLLTLKEFQALPTPSLHVKYCYTILLFKLGKNIIPWLEMVSMNMLIFTQDVKYKVSAIFIRFVIKGH